MTAPRSSFPRCSPILRSLLGASMLATSVAYPLDLLGQAAQPAISTPPPALAQPPNVGEAKQAAPAYHDSGAYARDLASVAAQAGAWLAERAPHVGRPALVLDIDDTALTNWEVIKADDFGRVIDGRCDALPEGPCGWAAWDLLGGLRSSSPPCGCSDRLAP